MTHYYAVMGNPIAHSLSPTIHQLFAELVGRKIVYQKILIDLEQFECQVRDFFSAGGCGLNITVPGKIRAFAMSEVVSTRSMIAQAANTLWMQEGILHADNTDGVGLVRDLRRYIDLKDKSILILGAGGAVRGVLDELLAAKPLTVTVSNRTKDKALVLQRDFPAIGAYGVEDLNAPYDVIINATSAGLRGESLALPAALLGTQPFCYDLSYVQVGNTPFQAWAKAHGCRAINGLGMLVEQAAESFYLWHGVRPDTLPVINWFLRKKR